MTQINKKSDTQAILDAIRNIVRALRVSSRMNEKECGLSSAQIFVLHQLQNHQGISMNELAELTYTHQSSVSVVVSKLCDQGLVSRQSSKADSRRVEIFLTSRGEKLLAKIPTSIQQRLIQVISEMPPKDVQQLADLLQSLVKKAGFSDEIAPLLFEDDNKMISKKMGRNRNETSNSY
jgi:DNA-binding MarR family transcriptional regulator